MKNSKVDSISTLNSRVSINSRSFWVVVYFVGFVGFSICIFHFINNKSESPRTPLATACVSNIKLQTYNLLMYAESYDQKLPSTSKWMDITVEMLGTTTTFKDKHRFLKCPALEATKKSEFGYAMTDLVTTVNKVDGANVPLVFESTDLTWNAHGRYDLIPKKSRHKRNAFGFLDGHAMLLSPQEWSAKAKHFANSK